jgi:hypothetical protein
MKYLFKIAFILLVLPFSLYAKCGFGSITYYPKSPYISPNSYIIIQDGANQLDLLKQISFKYKVFLVSGNNKIELKFVRLNRGFNLNQLILKPASTLKKGKKYKLAFEGVNSIQKTLLSQNIYNVNSNKWTVKEWECNEKFDNDIPVWIEKPTFVKATYRQLGCGPENYVTYKLNVRANSGECYVNVRLYNKFWKEETEFMILVEKDKPLNIGHNMCNGEFRLYDESEYDISFELMSISQNKAEIVNLTFVTPKQTSIF